MMNNFRFLISFLCMAFFFSTASLSWGQDTQPPPSPQEIGAPSETPPTLPPDPYKPEPPMYSDEGSFTDYSYGGDFVKMLFVLGLIVFLLIACAWFLKRFMATRVEQMNKSNAIKILERRTLSQKALLYLVEVHGKQILIGESASGINCLGDVPLHEGSSSPKNKPVNQQPGFREIMQRGSD